MQTTQMSSKGQVIIPKDIRARRHWLPGTRLVAEETPEGVLLRTARRTGTLSLNDGLAALHALAGVASVAGAPSTKGRPNSPAAKTLAEMDAAVAREAVRVAGRTALAAGARAAGAQARARPR